MADALGSTAFLHFLLHAIDLLGLFLGIGVTSTQLWILGADCDSASRRRIRARLHQVAFVSVCILVGVSLPLLALRAMEWSGDPWTRLAIDCEKVLRSTTFGWLWYLRVFCLTLLAVLVWRNRSRAWSRIHLLTQLGLWAMIAWTRSASGHASSWGLHSSALWIGWAHLFAAAIWGGSLVAFSISLYPDKAEDGDESTFLENARAAGRLSKVASLCILPVLLFGLLEARLQLMDIRALWESGYGRVLSVKIAIVMALLAAGALNHFLFTPRLRSISDRNLHRSMDMKDYGERWKIREVHTPFARLVVLEGLAVGGVLVCVTLLSLLSPHSG